VRRRTWLLACAVAIAAVVAAVTLAMESRPTLVLALTTPDQSLRRHVVSGYATGPRFPWSVQPGQTISFHVSCFARDYRVQMVRLFNLDPNPRGPGLVAQPLAASTDGLHPGHPHLLPMGSYITVPDSPRLRLQHSFTITAWIAPTTIPGSTLNPLATAATPVGSPRWQGLVTKWAQGEGYGLYLDSRGRLALRLGSPRSSATVATGTPLRPWVPSSPGWIWDATQDPRSVSPQMTVARWYFVAATYDATNGVVTLVQAPQGQTPDPTRVRLIRPTSLRELGANRAPLLIAAGATTGAASRTQDFNGKIDNPRLYGRALTTRQLQVVAAGGSAPGLVANWDFSRTIGSSAIVDTSANHLDGRAVNAPTSGVAGHSWDGNQSDFAAAPEQYSALYFHQDDLSNADWPVSFAFHVASGTPSGVYAAVLTADGHKFYIPYFVTPPPARATARIALVLPTYTYLAYGSTGSGANGLSLYSYHVDGSGDIYTSALRPIGTMQPTMSPRNFSGDMELVYWLRQHRFRVDILTDQNVNQMGSALLERYRVVITGAHPEYATSALRHAYVSYVDHGGRLMYLGGDGFYWVAAASRSGSEMEVRRFGGTEPWRTAPGEGRLSMTGEEGGLWSSRGLTPQQLLGVGFTAQGYGGVAGRASGGRPYLRTPASFRPGVSFILRGIGRHQPIGDYYNFYYPAGGAAGDEIDRASYTLGSPADTIVVASATGFSDQYLAAVEGLNETGPLPSGPNDPLVRADMAYTRFRGGGAVFAVGSIAWDSSLLYDHSNNDVSRVTRNVLDRFLAGAPLG